MNTILSLIIQLVSGAVGGNLAGLMKKLNLGPLGNSIAGIIGSFGGTQLFHGLGQSATTELSSLLGEVGSGTVGGFAVTAIAALVRNVLQAKK